MNMVKDDRAGDGYRCAQPILRAASTAASDPKPTSARRRLRSGMNIAVPFPVEVECGAPPPQRTWQPEAMATRPMSYPDPIALLVR